MHKSATIHNKHEIILGPENLVTLSTDRYLVNRLIATQNFCNPSCYNPKLFQPKILQPEIFQPKPLQPKTFTTQAVATQAKMCLNSMVTIPKMFKKFVIIFFHSFHEPELTFITSTNLT